ncbi:MAG: DUF4240 domain-containing protein [Bacteroidota bacterium]
MNEILFWKYIEKIYYKHDIQGAKRSYYDVELIQKKILEECLINHTVEEIAKFQSILCNKIRSLYLPKIGDIFNLTAYSFEKRHQFIRYISTDGFVDFRTWIVFLGQENYNIFLHFQKEEELLPYNLDSDWAYTSGLEYVTQEIYKSKNPSDPKNMLSYCEEYGFDLWLDDDSDSLFKNMNWDTLDQLYPKLFRKYQKHFSDK